MEWRDGGRRGGEREYKEEGGGLDLSLIPPADPTTGKLVTEMKYTFPPAVSLSVHKHVPWCEVVETDLSLPTFPVYIFHKMPCILSVRAT